MTLLLTLPSFMCGTVACVTDMAHRKIERFTIIVGVIAQFAVFIVQSITIGHVQQLLQACLIGIITVFIQCTLAICIPNSLGFGDITLSLLTTFTLGWFGFLTWSIWWIALACVGIVWTALFRWRQPHCRKMPFAPAIIIAEAITLWLGV